MRSKTFWCSRSVSGIRSSTAGDGPTGSSCTAYRVWVRTASMLALPQMPQELVV